MQESGKHTTSIDQDAARLIGGGFGIARLQAADHSLYCNCGCHDRRCDPSVSICRLEFLPDDGGLTPWGCPDCSAHD